MIAELFLAAELIGEPEFPDETPYVLVVWESKGTYPDVWPQALVTYLDQSVPDLHALDASMPPCGVAQIDLYWDDQTTADLIAGGILHGPQNPAESLAYVVDGDPWRVVDLGPCPVPMPTPDVPFEPPVTSVTPELASTGGPDWGVLAVLGPLLIIVGILGRRYWGNPERTSK